MNQKRRLTGEQEDGRIQGLRLLARIIARHCLEHPDLYPVPSGDPDGGANGVVMDDTNLNAAVGADGNAARKEAAQ